MGMAELAETPFHTLPPVLDLAGAELLHQQLRAACAQDSGIALNGAEVERVSTACLQVMAAAARSMRDRGLPFTLDAPSPALSAALADLGLSPLLAGAGA
jgi:anti-anti-sigma regulatory factor